MRMRYLIVAAIGLVAGLLLLVLWRTPRVTAWLPDTNEIRAGQNITFETNTSLLMEEFGSHFQIAPNVSGDLRIEGKSVYFDPHQPLEYRQNYTITLSPGIRGNSRLPSLVSSDKHYSVSEPKLLFMREGDIGANLWSQDGAVAMVQITDEPHGIWDYSILPMGEGVLVSSLNEGGSADLVRVSLSGTRDLILDCGGGRCLDGRWQPNSVLVAFEKSNGSTEVWLFDTKTGTEMPLREFAFSSDDGNRRGPSRYPRWSADGRYLSFYMPDKQRLAIIDMVNVDLWTLPANVDLMGDWSPSGYQLAFTELVLNESHGEENLDNGGTKGSISGSALSSRVKVIDIESREILDLGGADLHLEGVPDWSPDGTMMVVSRMVDGIRQILMIPQDDSGTETIGGDRLYSQSSPRWSPDGQRMAVMRSRVDGDNRSAGVWLLDLEDGQAELVVEEAYLPMWLP